MVRSKMRTLLLLAVAFSECASLPATASGHATFCRAPEEIFFNCELRASGKTVSLCGSADAANPWLQYRMGRPGQTPELVVPSRFDDPQMRSTFFYDVPSATRDGSYSQVGIWFRHMDAYYELFTSQNHWYQEGKDDDSAVNVWLGPKVQGAPRGLPCRRTSSSELLKQAGELIEMMAPKWHHWGISPWDWNYYEKLEVHDRAAAEPDAAQHIIPPDAAQ